MASFLVYDLIFFALFSVGVILFLVKHRKGLSREGIVFMYRTKLGMRAINYFGKKYERLLRGIAPFVIFLGFVLMGFILWILGQTLAVYVKYPEITKVIKAPPVAPLIPYFPRLFGMQSFFPPFYFTYFLVALAIVAIVHEFSHGIFMRVFGIKIKSTGIVFLGPILGAFVEEDRGQFEKKKNSEQMAVLAAGVFANMLFALIFYLLYVGFFYVAFQPAGYVYNAYGMTMLPMANVSSIVEKGNMSVVYANNQTYYLEGVLKKQLEMKNLSKIVVYMNSPAFLNHIKGPIIRMDDFDIRGYNDLRIFLSKKKPGDRVKLYTLVDGKEREYDIVLASRWDNKSAAYLGVGHYSSEAKGIVRKILAFFMSFKERSTYYKPVWDGDFVIFVYNLFWWVMLINLLVALFNMMPVGFLDGGRFFYLAVLSLTKSEKFAKRAFRFSNYLILFVFLLLMFFWFIGVI